MVCLQDKWLLCVDNVPVMSLLIVVWTIFASEDLLYLHKTSDKTNLTKSCAPELAPCSVLNEVLAFLSLSQMQINRREQRHEFLHCHLVCRQMLCSVNQPLVNTIYWASV